MQKGGTRVQKEDSQMGIYVEHHLQRENKESHEIAEEQEACPRYTLEGRSGNRENKAGE